MLTYNLTGNLIGSFVSGLMDAFDINDDLARIIGGCFSW